MRFDLAKCRALQGHSAYGVLSEYIAIINKYHKAPAYQRDAVMGLRRELLAIYGSATSSKAEKVCAYDGLLYLAFYKPVNQTSYITLMTMSLTHKKSNRELYFHFPEGQQYHLEELATAVRAKGDYIKPHDNTPFCRDDIARFQAACDENEIAYRKERICITPGAITFSFQEVRENPRLTGDPLVFKRAIANLMSTPNELNRAEAIAQINGLNKNEVQLLASLYEFDLRREDLFDKGFSVRQLTLIHMLVIEDGYSIDDALDTAERYIREFPQYARGYIAQTGLVQRPTAQHRRAEVQPTEQQPTTTREPALAPEVGFGNSICSFFTPERAAVVAAGVITLAVSSYYGMS